MADNSDSVGSRSSAGFHQNIPQCWVTGPSRTEGEARFHSCPAVNTHEEHLIQTYVWPFPSFFIFCLFFFRAVSALFHVSGWFMMVSQNKVSQRQTDVSQAVRQLKISRGIKFPLALWWTRPQLIRCLIQTQNINVRDGELIINNVIGAGSPLNPLSKG